MTTFYSQKSHVLQLLIAASFMAMFNLFLPEKVIAQNSSTLTVVAVPPVTANVTFEADDEPSHTNDVSSYKLIDQNQPDPGLLLAAPANDNCAAAVNLTSATTCVLTSGTTNAATQSLPAIACGGTGDAGDDVWYKFTATNTTHTITVNGNANMDPVIDLRDGCPGASIACSDANAGNGTSEALTYNSFIIGNVYYIRLYDFVSGANGWGNFQICITEPIPACIGDDDCPCALNASNVLTPGANYKCGTLAAKTVQPGENTSCFTPAPVATVWYSFIADQANMWIAVKPSSSICGTSGGTVPSSFGLAVYQSTTCLPAAPIACLNYYSAVANVYPAPSSYISKVNLTGLTPGSTYMVQIAIYASCAGNAWKPFCIKIGHPANCTTCATNCGPMCVWSGPSPPTPAQIAAVCPSYGWAPPMNVNDSQTNCFSFTATNDSVYLQQIVFASCSPGNTFSFTYNLYNNACGLIQSGNVFANNLITGLTVGTTYKICYTLTAACTWDSVFWPYAYTTSTTLPVELVSFGAMPLTEKVKIYWATASEENAKEFIIEKTRNGMDFTEIAHVKAAGNSTRLINYKGYDDHPLTGNNYYRLKQVDFNGKFTYTKLVSASYLPSMSAFSIVPNPAKDKAKIAFNSSGNYPVLLKITGMDGKVILNTEFISVEGINEYIIDMNKMTKGIYSVQLILDDQNQVSKLVRD